MSLLSNAADKSDKPDKLSLYVEEGFKKRKKIMKFSIMLLLAFRKLTFSIKDFLYLKITYKDGKIFFFMFLKPSSMK